ncbi:hypothetical protein MRB53_027540 [Persea americana]|uniref:Uncharacterized protein n=1 Tax=Persea americana TaxID=3435 RepID=A0ACC2LLA3_PERAE|nr:hypothetical protein MRB53_027540 [Persea americana]
MSDILQSDLDPPSKEAQAQNQEEEEWERGARTWLTTLPRRRNVTTDEMDVWIDSNLSSIPHQLISNPRSHLYDRIISLHKLIRRAHQVSDVAEGELPKRPFQRTEQWIPVYSWLESLDANEVVKSKAINEWLSQNPKVKEQLFATHSSYQLMHYIRKCHARILRKRGKLQKAIPATKPPTTITPINDHNAGPIPVAVLPPTITPVKDLNTVVLPVAVLPTTIAPVKDLSTQVLPVAVPLNTGSLSCNVPNDNDFSLSKKNEAFVRYEILTDLENQLTSILSKHRQVNGSK